MKQSDIERRSVVTGVKLPAPAHECPRPDRDEIRTVETEPTNPAAFPAQLPKGTRYIHLVSPSYPSGSEWSCPECYALWRVEDYPEVTSGCQQLGNRWVRVTSGFWRRVFRRPPVTVYPRSNDD